MVETYLQLIRCLVLLELFIGHYRTTAKASFGADVSSVTCLTKRVRNSPNGMQIDVLVMLLSILSLLAPYVFGTSYGRGRVLAESRRTGTTSVSKPHLGNELAPSVSEAR